MIHETGSKAGLISTRRNFLSSLVAIATVRGKLSVQTIRHQNRSAGSPLPDAQDFADSLPGTDVAEMPPDILQRQFKEISGYFLKEIAATRMTRDKLWHPDFSSQGAYGRSIASHRVSLRKMLGMIESAITPPKLTTVDDGLHVQVLDAKLPLDGDFSANALLFLPKPNRVKAAVVAIPSEDETREQFTGTGEGMLPARWLTALLDRGLAVGVPMTIERRTDNPLCQRLKLDRRRLLNRLGFLVGRTLTGLEVQQALGLRSFMASHLSIAPNFIGILGSGQGGMTALYAGAVDEEWGAVSVLNYFQQREGCWKEPVDRMLYGQLNEFGDAEVAALIAPRRLTILYTRDSESPASSVETEALRARRFFKGLRQENAFVVKAVLANAALESAATEMAKAMGAEESSSNPPWTIRIAPQQIEKSRDDHFESLHRYLRGLCEQSDEVRSHHWQLNSAIAIERPHIIQRLHAELSELMGVIPVGSGPIHPRTRRIRVADDFIAYDVLLNVVEGVDAYGQLVVPRRPQGRLPVVICQHGIGGSPGDATGLGDKPNPIYHAFAVRLAQRGYVTFSPYLTVPKARGVSEGLEINPLPRQAAAIGKMRTSIELTKLRRIIDFLETLPFVDAARIGYYGLSYGGYSALWMPPLEPRIKADVISGYFNDWRSKITDEERPTGYMSHDDEDFYNWGALNRFTHVELIASMWPRPACVEWGMQDPVTPPVWHWRAWGQVEEFIKAWNVDNCRDSVFDGVHEVHGVQTFEFLDNWLGKAGAIAAGGK